MKSLLAVFPPILALATLVYLLKQLKLGNLFSPKAALSMATAGVSKLSGEDRQSTNLVHGAMSTVGNAAKTPWRAVRNPRTREVAGATKRGVGTVARTANELAHMSKEERKEAIAKAVTSAKELTTKDGAHKAAASTAQVMAKLGVWALTEREAPEKQSLREKTLERLQPLTTSRDNLNLALEERAQGHALEAALRGAGSPEEMEAIRAEHDAGRLMSLGAANRNKPHGSEFDRLDGEVVQMALRKHAAIAGGSADQWILDPVTATILPGTGPALLQDMGSEEKTWEAAKHPAHYFSNNKMLDGENLDDFALRMTVTGLVTGSLSSVTGEWKDQLKEFNIPDTAEGRAMVMASTDPTRDPAITQKIVLTSEQEARVQSVMETMKQTRAAQEAPAALASSVLASDVRTQVKDVQALVESLHRELATPAAGGAGRSAQVQTVMAAMDDLASSAAETAKQIAAARATGTGSDASAAAKAAADAASAVEREVAGLSKKIVNATLGNGSADSEKIAAALDSVAHSLSFDFKKAEEEISNRAQIEAAAQAKAHKVMQVSSASMSRGRRAPSVL